MITQRFTVIYRCADLPFVTSNVDLIAGWRLYLLASRRGWCRICRARIEWPPPATCRAYRKTGRRPPTRLLHDPRCPASIERLQAEIRAGWS